MAWITARGVGDGRLRTCSATVTSTSRERAMSMRFPSRVALRVAAPVALFVALASWAISSPVGSSPDDDYHMASIWCGQGVREGLCEQGAEDDLFAVPAAAVLASECFAFDPAVSAACTEEVQGGLIETRRSNASDGKYPDVFYGVMSLFATPDVSSSVVTMRLFTAFLFTAFTTALCYLLPVRIRPAYVWGALATSVPLGMFIVPSVNPSGWAVLAAVTLWAATLGWLTESDRRRWIALGALAALACVAGAGARGDAAVYGVMAMTAAAIVGFSKTRSYRLRLLLPFALTLLSIVLFFTAGQGSVADPSGLGQGTPWSQTVALAITNLQLLPELWIGVLGFWGLGWLDTEMPGIVWVTTVAVVGALIVIGLKHADRLKMLGVGMVFTALIVIPMYILTNDEVLVGSYVQPRYIQPILIVLVGLALLRVHSGRRLLSRGQAMMIVIGLSVANAVALHINLRRYVTGTDVFGLNLDNATEWWWALPFGPMWVWAAGSVAFAALLVLTSPLLVTAVSADTAREASPRAAELTSS
ncbi:MAG: hypothetical protein C0444_00435 [Microbacterium sp.]|nr:hypothetical protein [Microbacterium sp.]MBA4346853.1 hypothetical protein [Microbacterium sp.]